MLSLATIIAATASAHLLVQCSSKDRQAAKRKSTKSGKSSKSKRSSSTAGSSKASSSRASSRSGKSGKSKSKSRRSSKSKKAGKSGKSGKEEKPKLDKDGKPIPGDVSEKKKSSKSKKDKSSKSSRKDKKEKKMKEVKEEKKDTSLSAESEKKLNSVPNNSKYTFPEGNVKPSTMKTNPNKLPFAPTGGVQSVAISNSTKSRKAFKVKTSDNLLYRVNPVYGFVEPGATTSIDVLRHNGEKKTDHLVVLTSDATKEQTIAKDVFLADPPRELTVVPLVAH